MIGSRRHVISLSDVLRQAVSDWTDKEVQAGYTYTYIWMANQLGHFTLGFLPTLLASWLILSIDGRGIGEANFGRLIWFPLALGAIWTFKEILDVKRAEKEIVARQFPLDGPDLWKDAGTAVFFFWYGIIVGGLGLWHPAFAVESFLLLLVAALVPCWYWLPRKLCFQRAGLPFLARLADFTSQFNLEPPRLSPKDVLDFCAAARRGDPSGPHHLLVFGNAGTGRTTLGIAIGTDYSFALRRTRYTTWTKFLEIAAQRRPVEQNAAAVWLWRDVDILILDDVVDRTSVTPIELLEQKKAELSSLPLDARKALREIRVVWVLGAVREDLPSPQQWIDLLASTLGKAPSEVGWIELEGGYIKVRVPIASLSGH